MTAADGIGLTYTGFIRTGTLPTYLRRWYAARFDALAIKTMLVNRLRASLCDFFNSLARLTGPNPAVRSAITSEVFLWVIVLILVA